MSERVRATATREKTSQRSRETEQGAGSSARLSQENPFFGLQQSIGNQATLRLLDGGVIQTKLRVSQPGDADEQEADRIAEQVVSSRNAPTIQRKCACSGGTPCAKCAGEEEETIHRSVQLPQVHSEESIQRAPAEQSATPAGSAAKPGHHHGPHPLVVEDDAKDIEPHQMRKSQFIALLRMDACTTADAVLMSVGHTTKGCPYIAKWLSFYEKQNSHHIEAAMQKYAPETARARSAHEAIRLLTMRIQKAATSWAKTGKVEGLPPEMASQIKAGKSLLEKAHDFATSGVAGAIFGFIGGEGKKGEEDSAAGSVMRKATTADSAHAHDAVSVRSQLGTGHSLDSRVQSQMSSAFGYDFSGVRVHTDSKASTLSSNLQARAFTIGNDVAFASNEYRPGTLIGDALIAHELAHVVQQGGGNSLSTPQRKAEEDDTSLERDADRAAAGAIISLWGKAKGSLFKDGLTAMPSVKSGLRLSRCNSLKTDNVPDSKDAGIKESEVPKDAGSKDSTVPDAGGNKIQVGTVTKGSAWDKCGRRSTKRTKGYTGDTSGTYINAITVTINANTVSKVALTWANSASAGVDSGALPNGFDASPGAGLCSTDCSDKANSARSGSHCTEIGPFVVQGYGCYLKKYPDAKFVTWFNYDREIAFHYYNVPSYPASHGCVRLPVDSGGAEWIYDNTLPSVTSVTVNRDSSGGPGPKCWSGHNLVSRPTGKHGHEK